MLVWWIWRWLLDMKITVGYEGDWWIWRLLSDMKITVGYEGDGTVGYEDDWWIWRWKWRWCQRRQLMVRITHLILIDSAEININTEKNIYQDSDLFVWRFKVQKIKRQFAFIWVIEKFWKRFESFLLSPCIFTL